MPQRGSGAHPHRFSAEGDFIERLEGPERSALIPREAILPRMRLEKSHTLVDLGSGIGYFSIPISSLVKRVVAVDLEPKMHEVLAARIRERSLRNIDLLRAQITALPILDSSVEHVLAAFVYHEVDSPRDLMAEGARILRTRSAMTVIDFQKRETSIGPPVSERKTPDQIRRSAPRSLTLRSIFETDVFYMLRFAKS